MYDCIARRKSQGEVSPLDTLSAQPSSCRENRHHPTHCSFASSPELIQRLNPLSVRPRRPHATCRRREMRSCNPALVADIQARRRCLCGFLPAERRAEELFNASKRFMTPRNRIAGPQSWPRPESTRSQRKTGWCSGHYPSLAMNLPLNYSWARLRMTSGLRQWPRRASPIAATNISLVSPHRHPCVEEPI